MGDKKTKRNGKPAPRVARQRTPPIQKRRRRTPAVTVDEAEPTGSARSLPSTTPAGRSPRRDPAGDKPFLIVAIGASAGGLAAFTQLLKQLPGDSGMAFVLIQHLAPSHKSLLAEMLSKATPMPVTQAADGQRVEPNHVYVIPARADLSIAGGKLRLLTRAGGKVQPHLPVDAFFTALAADWGNRAIGIVLSGNATDGTIGLRVIKAAGGITFAQDPSTAEFAGMPSSAVGAGVVDHSLPISTLAAELIRLSGQPLLPPTTTRHLDQAARSSHADLTRAPTQDSGRRAIVEKIMNVVRTVVGVDFREYKITTFERRLARRMAIRRVVERENYLQLLEQDVEEVRALYEDSLIHVSSFFRDAEVFEVLKTEVFPAILAQKGEGATIRVWVAGCSTGEEVYSLAIALLDFLGDSPHPHPLQIFGSDVSELAIKTARAGKYTPAAMRGVSEERRRRYFTRIPDGFRISKAVRNLCVFVHHDLARDPPFSRLDLVSCRNVLIYFDQVLQKRVLPTFHYSLNLPGFLVLGRTENISGFARLFAPVDEASKIFARSSATSDLRFISRPQTQAPPFPERTPDVSDAASPTRQLRSHLNNLLLARYCPPGVLINARMEILQFCGQTGAFLQAAPGEPQNNLVKMARPALLPKLHATLARARRAMAPARAEGVEVDQDGFIRTCDIVVLPFTGIGDVKEPLFLVLFEDASTSGERSIRKAARPRRGSLSAAHHPRSIPKLELELSATTEYLNSLIEEHSRANDDLGSANEELVSGNEELQSLNEELETAKEELQSTNEELTTVNDELHSRNRDVGLMNSDLVNLLTIVDIPIVILDSGRRVRRFTPAAAQVLNILPSDVGRLFDEIKSKIDIPDLDRQIAEVINSCRARESEIRDGSGRWYRLQLRPYKAADGSVDGAVVSLFDIDDLKHHLQEAEHGKEEAELADRAKDQFLAVLSHELRTPLTVLVMQTHLLRQGGDDPVKRARACDAIERSTQMQVQLIDDLLDVSRIVTGKMRMELQPMDLAKSISGTMDSASALAASKSIELLADLEPGLAQISGDRSRIEQMVSNLLVNAIKFTPRGGRVKVSLRRVGEAAELKVADSGIGIAAEFLPRIFDRLTQNDSSSTRAHAGLGLGLAIVRHLVEAHQGSIRAESGGIGQGATFYVTLPLVAAGAELALGPALPSMNPGLVDEALSAALSGRRVLVVDDDPDISEVLAEILTNMGVSVWTATSAAAGMTHFKRLHPDALLCDLAMPGEDGYALIRRIRALGPQEGGNTPAMALTARATDNDCQRALAEGFQMYVAKPVDVSRFIASVAQLLSDGAEATSRTPSPPRDGHSN